MLAQGALEAGQQLPRPPAAGRRVDEDEVTAAGIHSRQGVAYDRGLRPTQYVPSPASPAPSGSIPRFANVQSSAALDV